MRERSSRLALSASTSKPEAVSSLSVKTEIVSRPAERLAQNSSTELAPGNRPVAPMIAIPSTRGSFIPDLISLLAA